MEKSLYFKLSGLSYYEGDVTCKPQDVMQLIESDTESVSDNELQQKEYTVTPILMTEEEFKDIPECQ